MRPTILTLTLVVAFGGGAMASEEAGSLSIAEPAFGRAEIIASEPAPAEFEIALEREMPTPGWTFTVDAIETDTSARRIVARVTENRPAGMAAQVITPARLRLPLGRLAAGRYILEIRLRRGSATDHRPAHAMVLEAF